MAGKPVEFIKHEACGSGRLQVFLQDDGSYDGYCFACGTVVQHPYGDKPEGYKPAVRVKTQADIDAEIQEISEYPTVDLPKRGLKTAALAHFNVKIGMSEADGSTPESYYFPYTKGGKLSGYKVGLFNLDANGKKRIWSVGSVKSVELFGWQQAISTGAKRLFITEGEFDAIALWQMIMRNQQGTQWQGNIPAVVSIPHGAGNADKSISDCLQEIRKHFREVVLVFDNDPPGQDAVQRVCKIAPDFLVANLPCKDANQCLIEGHVKAAVNACMFKAEQPKNTRLVWGSSVHELARKEAEWGFSWPWRRLTDLTRGIRLGETIYIGAGVKMGKSEVANALAAHFIKEHGWKVFMAKPEEANRKTYQMVVGKIAGRIFHDPKIPFDYDAYDKAAPIVADNLCMVNLYQHLGWETLKADIRAAAVAGCKAVFIDPITNLTVGMNSADANTRLVEIATELSSMAMDLDIVIIIFCHLKAPEGGAPHERGGEVQSYQFAGSRAMMRACNLMIGIEGNKDPDLPEEERNVRHVVVLEDREFGNTGRIPIVWNSQTGLYAEV